MKTRMRAMCRLLQPRLRYCVSFRIFADASIVNGAPTVEPLTMSRATVCSTMKLNG